MSKLSTIFSSNSPIDCYILKGRLETEGITCFIFDEHIVSVNPFKAVAVGGVKLKIPQEKFNQAEKILFLISRNTLIDENGGYLITDILENEFNRQNEVLILKHKIRNDESLLQKKIDYNTQNFEESEFEEILKQEKDFLTLKNKKVKFSWNQFFYELLDPERSIFNKTNSIPVDYYIEQEIVEIYINQKESKEILNCPKCNSNNVSYGYAIDYKWDILYLIISFLLLMPLFLIRRKYHCFDCGYNFKKAKHLIKASVFKIYYPFMSIIY